MPGLAGIVSSKQYLESNPLILSSMSKIQIHEKYYITQTFIDNDMGIQIAWNDFDFYPKERNIVWNLSKNVCLLFIGEFYGNNQVIDIVEKFNIGGLNENLSSLIQLYEDRGLDFIKEINGFFCGTIIDYRNNCIHLFNDTFGINRIYYFSADNAFYFATEAKSLLKILPNLRSINYSSLSEMFVFNCVLGEKTLFKEISILPAGSIWTFSKGRLIGKRKFSFLQNENIKEEKYNTKIYERLRDAFPHIVSRYYKIEERIGLSLTGGLDTRLILAWAKFPPYRVPFYTYSGIYRDNWDARIAGKIAKYCQQHHHILKINKAFFSEFPSLAKKVVFYTDGLMDVTGAAELYMLKKVRSIAPIRLTGNYGDQILRGAVGIKPRLIESKILDIDFLNFIKNSLERFASIEANDFLDFFLLYQLPFYHYSRLSLEKTQVVMRTPYLDKELINILYGLPHELLLNINLTLRLISEGNKILARIPTDRGNQYPTIPIITNFKRFIREVEYIAEYVYDYGMPHWLSSLDYRLRKLNLSKFILGRQKYCHYRIWYKNELSSYVSDILLSQRALNRSYLNKTIIKKIIDLHVQGKKNYTNEINILLTSELINRSLIEDI